MTVIIPAGALHAGDTVLVRDCGSGKLTEAAIQAIDVSPDGCRAFLAGIAEPVCYAAGDMAARVREAGWAQ
jgi:hypothetical protein